MPPLGTAAAKALLDDPNTSDHVGDLYTFMQDRISITKGCVSSFLAQLQQHLQDNPQMASACSSTTDLTPFLIHSNSFRDHLRYHGSAALLPLLRQFCNVYYSGAHGAGQQLQLEIVKQDQLQSEINSLLTRDALNEYIRTASTRGRRCPFPYPRDRRIN